MTIVQDMRPTALPRPVAAHPRPVARMDREPSESADDAAPPPVTPCPIPSTAPPLPGRRVFDQRWRDLAFLHWAVDPVAVAPLLPAGTRPDLLDGRTYVGLVPFRMQGAGLGPLAVPYFGDFLETNVRLYSVDDEDRHGVVFCSLEASRLLTVLVARSGVRLPYCWSRMRSSTDGAVHTWSSRRRWPGRGPGTRISVRVGAAVEPTPVEQFVTNRWGMHSTANGHSWWTPNEHEPWTLHEAELLALDDSLIDAAGLAVDGPPSLRPLFSPGVRTRFGRPQRLRAPRRAGTVVPVSFRPVRQRAPNAMPS